MIPIMGVPEVRSAALAQQAPVPAVVAGVVAAAGVAAQVLVVAVAVLAARHP